MTAPQTWRMYAGRRRSTGVLCDVGTDPRHPKMHGHTDIVTVDVTEDPDGPYWGWIATRDRFTGDPKVPSAPVMIYEREVLFNVCFPYGWQAAEKAGNGRMVRLTVTPVADTAADASHGGTGQATRTDRGETP